MTLTEVKNERSKTSVQCLVLAVRRARARARARKALSVKSIMGNQVFGYSIGFRRTRTRWLFETAAIPIVNRRGLGELADLEDRIAILDRFEHEHEHEHEKKYEQCGTPKLPPVLACLFESWSPAISLSASVGRSAQTLFSLLPPCGGGKIQPRNTAFVAANLGPDGITPTEAKKSSMAV